MANLSSYYFKDEEKLKKQIQELEKQGIKTDEEKENYNELILKRLKIVKEGMAQAVEKEGYSLLVEDIARFLDIDEKHVRFNVIPFVDYIIAPQGAVEYFTLDNRPDLYFLDMQIYKWKRIFINQASFERYLSKYLMICCPYMRLDIPNPQKQKEPCYIEIPYLAPINASLIRSCNITHIIEKRKRNDLFERTEKEIVKAKALGHISQKRLEKEMGHLRSTINDIQFVVSTQEIKQFLKKNQYQYYQLKLYKEDDKGNKVKSTVLYWFLNPIS